MSVEQWLVFVGASFLLGITPGPDIIYVAARGAAQGPRAGVVAASGLCTGIVVHTAIVAGGVSEILLRAPGVYPAIRIAGAAYIFWIAWNMWRSHPAGDSEEPAGAVQSLPSIYRQTIVMNLLNPKVGLFFLAFLPQFVSADAANPRTQFVLLGATFLVVSFVVMGAAGVAAGSAGRWLSGRGGVTAWLPKAGAVVIGLIAGWTLLDAVSALL